MKMVAVVSKNKKKILKKPGPVKTESKFISQALINRKKIKGKKKKRPKTKGLIYIKNLPHGFYEEQLRNYFSQFGAVTRIRLGRSPTTLKSRGYAFIEFRYPEVAEIAAQAMNNYIMFHRIIKTKFIPPEQIRHDYFRSSIMIIKKKNGEKVMTSKKLLARQSNVENTNKLMTDADQKHRVGKVRNKINKQKAKLATLGIDFDIDSVAKNMGEEVIAPKVSRKALTIDNIPEDDLDGDDDETFDPSKFDINSGDEFEDHDYESNVSESDESEDEIEKKTKAIEVAKNVSKKYKDNKNGTEEKQKVVEKAGKNKKGAQKVEDFENPTKKMKMGYEKSQVETKPKKLKEKVKKAQLEVKSTRKLRGTKGDEDEPQIIVEPAKKQHKKVAEKAPVVEDKAVKLKQSTKKELKFPVEKKLAVKKNVKKGQSKLETGTQKKATKVPKGPLLKAKESPKLKKASKVNKKVAVK